MTVTLPLHTPGVLTQPARQRPHAGAAAPAPVAVAKAAPDAPPKAPPSPQADRLAAALHDSEGTIRTMREEFMSRRLDLVEELLNALSPFMSLMTTAHTARALAVTAGSLARQIESVVDHLGGETDRRAAQPRVGTDPTQPDTDRFAGLVGFPERIERAISGTSLLLRNAASVYDRDPLNRGTPLDVAVDSSRPLLSAIDKIKGTRQRLAVAHEMARNQLRLTA